MRHVVARAFGLGSIFGKTLRDSRGAMLVVLGLLGLMIVAGGEVMATTYGSAAARADLAALSSGMPASLRGLYGDPLNVDTTGGFINWHYGAYFALIAGLWSILALSATLAAEARRGSLDLVLAGPHSRRTVALEKIAAHLVSQGVVAACLGVLAWAVGIAFALGPRDEIAPSAAAAFAVGVAVRSLAAGAVAWALAPLIGRGAAAGAAGALMVAGYVIHGYRTVVPTFERLDGLTWWAWTAGHTPLAGSENWGGVAITALVTGLLFVLGTELFIRRDIGVTLASPLPGLPAAILGVRGPIGRAFGEALPTAVWWGIGLGTYGATMAIASGSMIDLLASAPGLTAAFRSIIPGIDLTTAAGFLQLAFVDFGFVLFGLAAMTFVGGRWADEASGRLEVLLAAPLSRVRWALGAGIADWLATLLLTLVLAGSIGAGVGVLGQDPFVPAVGTAVLALYGCALVGVGMAAGGLGGPGWAGPAVGAVAIGTFLLDTLAPILRLPDWVAQLALTTHLGEPMVGRWEADGVIACLVIAAAGVGIGALGLARRDVCA